MANEFLETQKEISELQRYKAELEGRLAQADQDLAAPSKQTQNSPEEVEKLLRLQSERVRMSIRDFHSPTNFFPLKNCVKKKQ